MTEISREAIDTLALRLHPGGRVERVRQLGEDVALDGTEKGIGYGAPIEVDVREGDALHRLVLHTAKPNEYGHDRRADRAEAMLLAWDTFGSIPRHAPALDVGGVDAKGELRSIADLGELYLVTGYLAGEVYADDLRRLAAGAMTTPRDLRRVDALADYLVALHAERREGPALYRRALRDLLGHGEGIFGIVDGYPTDTPAAPAARLQALEAACHEARWTLRDGSARLCRTHGDFHPFNLLFDDQDALGVLDTSRGSLGDAADDVVCLAINFPFFALGHEGAWERLGPLWHRFLSRYLGRSGDAGLLEAAPPYLAWRALVLASPAWYPHLAEEDRDALLCLAERVLARGALELGDAERMFS